MRAAIAPKRAAENLDPRMRFHVASLPPKSAFVAVAEDPSSAGELNGEARMSRYFEIFPFDWIPRVGGNVSITWSHSLRRLSAARPTSCALLSVTTSGITSRDGSLCWTSP